MIAVDAIKWYMYAWSPRHKQLKKEGTFTQEGPMELKRLCKKLIPLVKGHPQEEDGGCCQIFAEKRNPALARTTTSVVVKLTHTLARKVTKPL